MTVRRLSIVVGVGILLAAAMGMFLMGGLSADKKPSKAEERLANLAKEVVIPLEVATRRNPLAGDDAAQQGRELYQQSCSVCHGSDGRSEIPFGRAMYPPAMDLTSPHVRKWRDAELFWIIENGVRFTGMPAWHGLLDEPSMWKLVLAIRQLQQAGPQEAPPSGVALTAAERLHVGALLFRQQNCVGCHRLQGEGGRVGPDLSEEGDRGRSNAWMIGHFKNPGAFVPGSLMPATINLNTDQLLALTEFLQSQHHDAKR